MSNEDAYNILENHRYWGLRESDLEIKQALAIAIKLLEKYRCGYCDCIMDSKSKNKYGYYGKVCDNCYENLS